MNTFGICFRLTTFGESHGPGVGGVVDGCPAGLPLDVAVIQAALDRRRPGQSYLTSPRQEADRVEILSGLYEGRTTGTPIAFLVRNEDQRPADYAAQAAGALRPGHSEFTWLTKYGHADLRGGGRASARETLARVAGGAVAAALLAQQGIRVRAYVSAVGEVEVPVPYTALDLNLNTIDATPVRCPHPETATRMIARIEAARAALDTVGGLITGVVTGLPVGLGEPVFGKLPALLGGAMLGINAVKGFEIGEGFAAARRPGSAHNDAFTTDAAGRVHPATNHAGGTLGGLSTGEDVVWRVAFKPVATLPRETSTLTLSGEAATIPAKGRHDPCVLPRAVPIVEAMAALVLADLWLLNRNAR